MNPPRVPVAGALTSAPARVSKVREEEATGPQVPAGPGVRRRRRRPGPDVLGRATRNVARATQLWRIRSYADNRGL